jgi:hypothetical protein
MKILIYVRKMYRILVGKPEGKIPLGKPNNGWESNVKMLKLNKIYTYSKNYIIFY